ncbi:MAG: tetratricopeptide repeat protein [Polyangiaceae bacterium]|jgi:tetratricopeptide (TPR) repeat protein|nr:tetratricopeptide repeat protein [Polyangiaceae bacterium]
MWKRFFARRRYRRAIDQALAAMTARKPEAAREALGRAVAAATVAFDGRGLDLATTLYALAANQLEAGLLDEALISARESDRVLADTPEQDRAGSAPEETPSVARVRGLIAAILERRGVKGEEHETALLGWAEAARAEKDDEAAGAALNQLGLTLARRGDRAAAADLFLGALEHRTKRFGADGLPTLEALYNLATYRDEGRTLDVVATDLERIASTLEGRSEPRAAELKESTLHNLAALREEQGDYAAAEALFERALKSREVRLGPTHTALRPTLVRLAQLHHREGRVIHALGLYDRGLAIAKKELGDEHPIVVAISAWRAEVTQGLGPEAIRRN